MSEIATLAGGCFWCLEAVFNRMAGVESAISGYLGGHVENPTYRQVCDGNTGHAEVVQITFDPTVTSFDDLLEVFFAIHDPTTLNRQGNDVGSQYRSGIYYHTQAQRDGARAKISALGNSFAQPIITEVTAATRFWPAEPYHQDYFTHNAAQPYCVAVVAPKVAKFQQKFREKWRS
jgi:peptide-methionine (S)-S-oxide reductase